MDSKQIMFQKIEPELKLEKIEEEEEEEIALEKDDNNVELHVPISEQKKVIFDDEIDKKVIVENELCVRNEEYVEVNIIGNYGFKGLEEGFVDLNDVTESENESSFGDTGSDEFGKSDDDGDEFQSPISDEWSHEPPQRVRNKKVTDHWRKFINPIMWRCKWVEMQIVKLNSQAKKYERELAALDQQKQLDFLKFAVDDFDVKSVPRSEGIQRNKIMMRKKRKKDEECSSSSYMSSHRLFSYYENKNHSYDDASAEDLCDDVERNADDIGEEFKFNDMWSSVNHHEDNDKAYLEIIKKIDELLSHVEVLKTRIDTVTSENSGKFCSINQLSTIGSSDENTKDEVLMQNQEAKEELLDLENEIIQLMEKSNEPVEGHKSISSGKVSDSDMVTENVVPNNHSIKACSTSKAQFPRNTRRVRRKYAP